MGERIPEPFDFAQGERTVAAFPARLVRIAILTHPFVLSEVEAHGSAL